MFQGPVGVGRERVVIVPGDHAFRVLAGQDEELPRLVQVRADDRSEQYTAAAGCELEPIALVRGLAPSITARLTGSGT